MQNAPFGQKQQNPISSSVRSSLTSHFSSSALSHSLVSHLCAPRHGSLPLLSVSPLSHNLTHILTDPATHSQVSSSGVSMENVAIVKGDKLILRGLKFHGYHGVKPEERKLGQKFLVDVDAWLDLQPAGKSDCLSDTVSYTDIYRIVKEVVEGPAHNLLESVAQLIASTTFTKHPQLSAVRVVVGKPHVAVPGSVDYLGVEILRYRSVDASN